jgi:AcrR family transcriptional regulator
MATAPRSRNRRGEGSHLRTEILAAATELLDSTGNEQAVTLRAVARRAGITAPSIYPHFPDRPAIMLAVRRQAFTELTGALRSAADEDPRQRLLAICQTYLEFAQQHPERYRTMFSGLGADLGVETTRILTDSLSACVTADLCTSKDPAADASALWLGLHGFAHQLTVTRSYPWPADLTQRIAVALAHLTTAD